ncbi:MAG: IclR family transcriptional regulator [Rhodococcus sp. (in: high G+C Gram-positive bacteria)]|uniref:IclR family transcriptional regulator domain-containing protein n=1 Tax=Rhodococcus TaxID=1827 RepID=UPI0013290227|nr:helix-turn-helix domain-containing protein [Rhodococcus rhodochrous]
MSEAQRTQVSQAPKRELPASMVERMTLILDAFDDLSSRLTLEEVACRTQLPRSTVHRILDQMVRLDWIDHASFGYCLGRRAKAMGEGDNGHIRVREAAAPLLHELHMTTGMVAHLSVLDGPDCVYLDKIGGQLAATLPSRVGGRVPAYSTAGGKALLAGLEPEQVDALYPGPHLPRRTERTIADLSTLHLELNRIRRRHGLAFETGEATTGMSCVGAAIRSPASPVAAISLCGPTRPGHLERIAPLVAGAVRDISHTLYPELSAPRRIRAARNTADSWSPQVMEQMLATQSDGWM